MIQNTGWLKRPSSKAAASEEAFTRCITERNGYSRHVAPLSDAGTKLAVPSTKLRTGPSTKLRTGPSARLRTGFFNILLGVSLVMGVGWTLAKDLPSSAQNNRAFWLRVGGQAETLGLPVRFLTRIPPEFLTIEFEDLRAYAAEYHPDQHRMVLNRALSFHSAGGTLKPLSLFHSMELATFYHELFHAYMDVIRSGSDSESLDSDSRRLLLFALNQERCRYHKVLITPVVQRKSSTEVRFLTPNESWEALNETWAVFIGWAVWTKMELLGRGRDARVSGNNTLEEWLERLEKADREGVFVGYYEPENPEERRLTNKRYLAPAHRITPTEVALLLEVIFEETSENARRSAGRMARPSEGKVNSCLEGRNAPSGSSTPDGQTVN